MSDLLSFGISLEDAAFRRAAIDDAEKIHKLALALTDARGSIERYNAKLATANATGNIAGHERYSLAVQRSQRNVDELTRSLGLAKIQQDSSQIEALASSFATVGTAAATAAIAVGAFAGGLALYAAKTALDVTNENERLVASFEALGGAGAGDKTLDFLDDLSKKLPQSRGQLAEWTKQFQALGITDLRQL